jgi:hypothetical protein
MNFEVYCDEVHHGLCRRTKHTHKDTIRAEMEETKEALKREVSAVSKLAQRTKPLLLNDLDADE